MSPPDLHLALAGMVDRPFLASQRYQEQQKRALRESCHPDLLEFERCFVKRMEKLGIPMFANEFMRSDARQAELKAQGFSDSGPGQSPHQHGMAVDIVHGLKGWQLNEDQWRLVGHVGKELAVQKGIKLAWGGDWMTRKGKRVTGLVGWDPAHWEIAGWKALRDQYPFPRVMKWAANWKERHDAAVEAAREAHAK